MKWVECVGILMNEFEYGFNGDDDDLNLTMKQRMRQN